MSESVSALIQGSITCRKDMLCGFLSTTKLALVTAGKPPQLKISFSGQCVDSGVKDEFHGSLWQSKQVGLPSGIHFHLLEELDKSALLDEFLCVLCPLPLAVFLDNFFDFALDGVELSLSLVELLWSQIIK